MWPQRTRKKKLIVAFHFQAAAAERGGRTGWDCESCRRNGLERKRRCGFLPAELRGEPRLVWGRRQTRIEECPKSFITGESLAWIEEYFVARRLCVPGSLDTEARKVDAFLLLKDLIGAEGPIVNEESDGTSQY